VPSSRHELGQLLEGDAGVVGVADRQPDAQRMLGSLGAHGPRDPHDRLEAAFDGLPSRPPVGARRQELAEH
jgi:hypothetical protein